MQKLIAIVPVRAGSKGFPGKNTRKLEGTPLYLRAALQGVRTTGGALISTDIEEILQSKPPTHIEVCCRPDQLSSDYTPMEFVLKNVIESKGLHDFTVVLLQATSPLRRDVDIRRAIELYSSGFHDLVMSVVKKDKVILKYGTLEDSCFKAVRDPSYCFQNRQQLPDVYAPNGAVYVFSARKFIEEGGFPMGKIGAIPMAPEYSLDIDTESDFKSALKAL
jgi:N-acylneuraminate cytidylyltransferase